MGFFLLTAAQLACKRTPADPLPLQPPSAPRASQTSVVDWIAFGAETYAAITPENLAEEAHQHFLVPSDDIDLQAIIHALAESDAGDLDTQKVRMKIEDPNVGIILIDQAGGVRTASGERKLPARVFDRVRAAVKRLVARRGR